MSVGWMIFIVIVLAACGWLTWFLAPLEQHRFESRRCSQCGRPFGGYQPEKSDKPTTPPPGDE